MKEAALAARALGGTVVAWRFDAPSISVYRGAVTPQRPPEPGELAITRIDRLPQAGYETLFRKGGVVLVRRLAESAPQAS